ncbi:MAG: TolC family protein [Ginsengibacter sp.]
MTITDILLLAMAYRKVWFYKILDKRTSLIAGALLFPVLLFSQGEKQDSLQRKVTLIECVAYAQTHNPQLDNARLNEQIVEAAIRTRLSDWYPQLNFNYNLQHNFQLPTVNFNGNFVNTGTQNTSGLYLGATQNIFNPDVLLASRSAHVVRQQASQSSQEQKINIGAAVSKAYYDVILTTEQIGITEQDIQRTQANLKDAFYQYQSGIVDKTDYKRATIAVNNASSQKVFYEQSLKGKFAYLKELMGYPLAANLQLAYDTVQMANNIYLDTLYDVNYSGRIEIRLLETQKKLQAYNLEYYKWSFLPTMSAFGNYNLNFLNNQFSKLYSKSFPTSFAGIGLAFPIFQGGKRIQQIKQAQLQISQVDNDIISLKNSINTEYTQALGNYKSNLKNYTAQRENVALANEVYEVIRLQYRSGIKPYLDVITAEADVRTAQINLYNALNQLLSSKIDVQKALGLLDF